MILRALAFAPVLVLLAGCGSSNARLKGELVEDGKPVAFPAGAMAAVVFRPLDSNGRPSETVAYKAVVSPAGAFEWVGETGELPPGAYQLSLDLTGSLAEKYKHFARATSKRRVDLKGGANVFVVDLAKAD